MKDYKRLTPNSYTETIGIAQHDKVFNQAVITQAWDWENKIESGELCELEEIRKETAREILLLLGKGFDETARKDFKDLPWYESFCRELKLRYGIELFGKTEQVGNSDKLEEEE